ncbi:MULTISPECIES: O-antigen ligase [Streptomyces]|uniref:O-antigen ligase family protein n=1 Tax=Streptomyces mirabilis TaxID=68239 RepID=A0ABU3UTK8_9ACTN|nr:MULTISPECIES: O-antigen ligase family protein [Streptomyces]MDU8997255.1 O-antigen ligase family protein [Streptomyces mirabilis]
MTPGDADQLLWFAFAALCAASVVLLAACVREAASFLWTACLVPLFLLGRSYAAVGVAPVYLMDCLAALALLAAARTWAPRAFSEERLRGFRWVAVLLAVVTVPAVCRGIAADYPDPLKGVILGLYPVIGWLAATWLLTRAGEELVRLRWVLYVPTLGVLVHAVFHVPMTSAASGLYMAIAGAFGVTMRCLGRSRLLLVTLIGAALLTAAASKRGPLLAVLAAMAATAFALRTRGRRLGRWPVLSLSLVTLGLVAVVSFSASQQRLSDVPVVGGLATRLEASTQDPDSEAANNVELRFAMWQEALKEAGKEPLLGAGAGRPIDVVFERQPLNDLRSGPHNSFVGYVYYLGWPAGIALVFLVAATLRRTWRARHHPVASAWFGATVGVCITALTNVALEVTFIGLPSWLVLASAYARVGVPLEREASSGSPPTAAGHLVPAPGGSGARTERSLTTSPPVPNWS